MSDELPAPDPERRCSETCLGWFIAESGRGPEIQRCDDCWHSDPRDVQDITFEDHPVCQTVFAMYCGEDPPVDAGKDPVWHEALELFYSGAVCAL